MDDLSTNTTGNKDDAQLGDALERGFRSAGWRGALAEGIKEP